MVMAATFLLILICYLTWWIIQKEPKDGLVYKISKYASIISLSLGMVILTDFILPGHSFNTIVMAKVKDSGEHTIHFRDYSIHVKEDDYQDFIVGGTVTIQYTYLFHEPNTFIVHGTSGKRIENCTTDKTIMKTVGIVFITLSLLFFAIPKKILLKHKTIYKTAVAVSSSANFVALILWVKLFLIHLN
jgi:hypothetical protein